MIASARTIASRALRSRGSPPLKLTLGPAPPMHRGPTRSASDTPGLGEEEGSGRPTLVSCLARWASLATGRGLGPGSAVCRLSPFTGTIHRTGLTGHLAPRVDEIGAPAGGVTAAVPLRARPKPLSGAFRWRGGLVGMRGGSTDGSNARSAWLITVQAGRTVGRGGLGGVSADDGVAGAVDG